MEEFTVTTAKQLAAVAAMVNANGANKMLLTDGTNTVVSNSFEGITIKLGADIDLSAHYWTPIGLDKTHSSKAALMEQDIV